MTYSRKGSHKGCSEVPCRLADQPGLWPGTLRAVADVSTRPAKEDAEQDKSAREHKCIVTRSMVTTHSRLLAMEELAGFAWRMLPLVLFWGSHLTELVLHEIFHCDHPRLPLHSCHLTLLHTLRTGIGCLHRVRTALAIPWSCCCCSSRAQTLLMLLLDHL